MDETALLAKAKAGSVQAFEQLLEVYERRIYNIALRTMRNREDAQDMAQEAIVKIYRNLNSFQGACSFSSWIYRITVNTCLDEIRRRERRRTTPIDNLSGETMPRITDIDMLPEQAYEAQEALEAVRVAMNRLDTDARAIIVLRDVQGFSYQEISDILECNLGTVKSRINRARSKLKTMLKK